MNGSVSTREGFYWTSRFIILFIIYFHCYVPLGQAWFKWTDLMRLDGTNEVRRPGVPSLFDSCYKVRSWEHRKEAVPIGWRGLVTRAGRVPLIGWPAAAHGIPAPETNSRILRAIPDLTLSSAPPPPNLRQVVDIAAVSSSLNSEIQRSISSAQL